LQEGCSRAENFVARGAAIWALKARSARNLAPELAPNFYVFRAGFLDRVLGWQLNTIYGDYEFKEIRDLQSQYNARWCRESSHEIPTSVGATTLSKVDETSDCTMPGRDRRCTVPTRRLRETMLSINDQNLYTETIMLITL
jgi:hypothetical protein